jgi:hypothetical protein
MGGQGGQGFRPPLPEGVTQEQWDAIRAKRQAGEPLTPAESTIAAQVRAAFQARMAQQGGTGAAPGGPGGPTPSGPPAAGAPMGGGTTSGQAAGGGGASGFASMLPPGVSEAQARSIMQRGFSGGNLSAEERATFNRIRQSFSQMSSGSGQRRRFGTGNNFQFGGSYIVFKLDSGVPTPVRIRTGVTDMDYSEVVTGLTEQDSVVLLPSASLVQSQQEMRERMSRFGGGAVPGMRQTTSTGTTTRATTGGSGGGAPAGPPPR